MEEKSIDAMSYQEASTELESLVRSLEQGDLELEESLASFSRGVEIIKNLRERLSQAEQKVQVLLDASSEAPAKAEEAASSDELPF